MLDFINLWKLIEKMEEMINNNPNIQIFDDCISSNNFISFNISKLLPNHFYYLLINGFSAIDSIELNSTCSFQLQVSGPAIQPEFSAGEDIYVNPQINFQLNAFGFGNPYWFPNNLMDSIYSFSPNLSLNSTTEFLLTITDSNNCIYKDLVKNHPAGPGYRRTLAQIDFALNDYQGAINYYNECLEIAPYISVFYEGIGQAYEEMNQDDKAIEIAKQLRSQGNNASVFFGKLNKAFEYAEAYGMKKIIFVGKKEFVKVPLFGSIYKRAAILVDRSSSKSRWEVYGRANKILEQGRSVCIFPEVSYVDDTILLNPFKKGAFKQSKF